MNHLLRRRLQSVQRLGNCIVDAQVGERGAGQSRRHHPLEERHRGWFQARQQQAQPPRFLSGEEILQRLQTGAVQIR